MRAVKHPAFTADRVRGFTLLELLVTIVIAGVLVGVVAFSVTGFDRGLRHDAERLAQLLMLAREEAQLRGTPIRLEADDERYRFSVWRERRWRVLVDDRDLRPREWTQRTELGIESAEGRREIVFGIDPVDAPFVLRLRRNGEEAAIAANGLGLFEVLR